MTEGKINKIKQSIKPSIITNTIKANTRRFTESKKTQYKTTEIIATTIHKYITEKEV
jgi:phosphoribosylpyrophosphate synthetase